MAHPPATQFADASGKKDAGHCPALLGGRAWLPLNRTAANGARLDHLGALWRTSTQASNAPVINGKAETLTSASQTLTMNTEGRFHRLKYQEGSYSVDEDGPTTPRGLVRHITAFKAQESHIQISRVRVQKKQQEKSRLRNKKNKWKSGYSVSFWK